MKRPDPTRCEAAARRIEGLLVYTSLEKARALVAFSLGLTPAEQRGAEALRRRMEERMAVAKGPKGEEMSWTSNR